MVRHLFQLLFITIVSTTVFYSYGILHNTLEHNGRWMSTKTVLEKDVMGSKSFYTGTQALAFGKLNLSQYYGFQEVITKEEFSRVNSLRFTLELQKKSYAYLIFNKVNESFSAVRFSVNPSYPSAYVRGFASGEFSKYEPIGLELERNKTYQVEIKTEDDNGATLYLDGIRIVPLGDMFKDRQRIGFRGSFFPAFVDSVQVTDEAGQAAFSDDFSYYDRATTRRFFGFLAFGAVVYLLVCQMYLYRSKYVTFLYSLQLGLVSLSLMFFGAVLFLSDKYFTGLPIVSGNGQLIQQSKAMLSEKRLKRSLHNYPLTSDPVVLFLGSSQTWGAGAAANGDEYVSRIGEALRKAPKPYQVVNAGFSGLIASDLVSMYEQSLEQDLHPSVVVVDLSSNDYTTPDDFERSLRKLVSIAAAKAQLVFVLEPNAIERSDALERNHETMKQIAKENGIPVIDAQRYMNAQIHRGILWWDFVHPTTFGHHLLGEYIAEQLMPVLEKNGSATAE